MFIRPRRTFYFQPNPAGAGVQWGDKVEVKDKNDIFWLKAVSVKKLLSRGFLAVCFGNACASSHDQCRHADW